MKAMVIGATGLTGQSLLQQLLQDERYDAILVLSRKAPPEHPKLIWQPLDLKTLANSQAEEPVDHAYCCLGTTLKKAGSKAAFKEVDLDAIVHFGRYSRAQTLVVVSSRGASPRALVFYSKIKGQMEQALMALGLKHLVIMRPSLLLGQRAESRPLEDLAKTLYQMIRPWVHQSASSPVEATQVARAMHHWAFAAHQPVQLIENPELKQF